MALPPWFYGLIGVVAFSGTLPATRLALPAFGPVTVGLGRAVVAGVVAAAVLLICRAPWPRSDQWWRLGVVALGVVVGFPILSAFALQVVGASHGAILVGLMPVATAVVAAVRIMERPGRLFWVASLAGTAMVIGFALASGAGSLRPADLLLLGAVLSAAIGYADGAVVARVMPGWQVISWALVLSLPVLVPVCAVGLLVRPPESPGVSAWLGLGYVALFSMFLGFLAWYHAMARGGVARVGQLQLVQPIFTLLWAAMLLGEHFGAGTVLTAIGVLACTAATQRTRAPRPETQLMEVTADVPRPDGAAGAARAR
ncbi:MAG TPA: DMT family transporter [Mycobacteriales bacterium]